MKKIDDYIPARRLTCGRAALAIGLAVFLVLNLGFWTPIRNAALETPLPKTHDDAHTSPAAPGTAAPEELQLADLCRSRFYRSKLAPYCSDAAIAPETVDEAPLEVFQVHTPPYIPEDAKRCEMELMQHTFGWSYGKPFVGEYTPPDCEWNRVVFNLTMTSRGRQFDRLGMLFLGDVEVWRTSTAEPTPGGIITSHTKEMTHLAALLREKQTLIFDLGNLVNDVYTGSFNTALTATFFHDATAELEEPAHDVIALTARRSAAHQPSHFTVPPQNASSTFTLPKNTIRAHVTLSATGNAAEEFWYTNVPDEYTHTFPTALPGHGPFREIQLLLDGELAGAIWPRITVFTGGLSPSLWRPIVGLHTFDLPEYTLDITPLLPLLLRAGAHTAELRVLSYSTLSRTLVPVPTADWLLSARLHLWRDPNPAWTTTGTLTLRHTPAPSFDFAATLAPANTTLALQLATNRIVALAATLNTSTHPAQLVRSVRSMVYASSTLLAHAGNHQFLRAHSTDVDSTPHGSVRRRAPFVLRSEFAPREDAFALRVELQHGEQTVGKGRMRAAEMRGSGTWESAKGGEGWMSEIWADAEAGYARKVEAAGGRVVGDWERWERRGEAVEVGRVLEEICGDCAAGEVEVQAEVEAEVEGWEVESAAGRVMREMDTPVVGA